MLVRPDADSDAILARGREVVRIEADALRLLENSLDDAFIDACRLIHGTRRQLVVTGMGKSGHIARKVAATFAATGTPATFVHPAEAGHGDLGMLVEGDVLLVFSNSGNTAELHSILTYASKSGIPIIGVAARQNSLVMGMAEVAVLLPEAREACAINFAPTTSTAIQLALGDALAMTVMDMRGISKRMLGALHPAGTIGFPLTPVRELMHGPDRLPLVSPETHMSEAISIMTNGRFGIAGVIDPEGRLIGVITDGDVRRHFDTIDVSTAAHVMTPAPKSIPADMLVDEVLVLLNEAKITAAFVVGGRDADQPACPIGIVHVHDLLRFGLK
ncbi:KpsF/GutQ family sugar-phosphate isomerase [Sphingomonas sp. GB1N7]|uniref:KpsF/GutQ family sugar-phosphate isomerase n=1 Tax=Parasphingomonas caseinilytica TaxID=3096158 RepID=UPI002FC75066